MKNEQPVSNISQKVIPDSGISKKSPVDFAPLQTQNDMFATGLGRDAPCSDRGA
jgi:hypothetical protein